MQFRSYFSIGLLFLLTSCNDQVKKDIEGNWTIERMFFFGKDCQSEMLSNLISFKDDGSCSGPRYDMNDSKVCSWAVEKNGSEVFLHLESSNIYLNGHHKVQLHKDMNRKLLVMKLNSESLEFQATKVMHRVQ